MRQPNARSRTTSRFTLWTILSIVTVVLALLLLFDGQDPAEVGPSSPGSFQGEDGSDRSPDQRGKSNGSADSSVPPSDLDGTVVLRQGGRYVLRAGAIQVASKADVADIVCLRVGTGVSLKCPFGSQHGFVVPAVEGLELSSSRAFLLFESAPRELPLRSITLFCREGAVPGGEEIETGVGFVRSRTGNVFTVVVEASPSPDPDDAPEIRLRCREIPASPGGGVLHLGEDKEAPTLSQESKAWIHRSLESARGLSGNLWFDTRPGSYVVVKEVADRKRVLSPRGPFVVKRRLEGRLEVGCPGAILVLLGGAGERATVHSTVKCAVLVAGNMEGSIKIGPDSFVHVSGDVSGRLTIRGTAIIDGRVYGHILLDGALTRCLIRGPLTDSEDWLEGRGLNELYLESFLDRSGVVALRPVGGSSWELHLKSSDLPAGGNPKMGSWSGVQVAGDIWKKIGR